MNAKAKLKIVLDVAMTLALLPKADRAGCVSGAKADKSELFD